MPYWEWLKADRRTVLALYGRSRHGDHVDYPNWPALSALKIESVLDAFIGEWPKLELKSNNINEDSDEENAYRYLTEVVWSLSVDDPDASLPVIERLLVDRRYISMQKDLKSIRAAQIRKKALRNFEPPSPSKVVGMLDKCEVVTVEGLRALLIDELLAYQADLNGSETTSKDVFYKNFAKGERIVEVPAALRVADRLRLLLKSQGITVEPEKQMKAATRCDITCTKMIDNVRKLLVVEVKGQWHKELYTAAVAQLHERYSIHPDAEQQGVYLVLWFGPDEKVAGLKNTAITSAHELKKCIQAQMPTELRALVDVFVLDVSKV